MWSVGQHAETVEFYGFYLCPMGYHDCRPEMKTLSRVLVPVWSSM